MTKYKFYNFYFRLNCDQIEAYFTLYFQNILNITSFGNNLNFPSNFACSSRISFKFPSKFISFKFPSFCKKFLSKGNFLQSGSAALQMPEMGILVILQVKAVLPFSKSKFLIFIIKISLNSLDCIRYFLENSLKFH